MKQATRLFLKSSCLALVLNATGIGMSAAYAESSMDDVQVQGEFDNAPRKYKGTIDRIPSNGRSIIVDDTLLDLDNVVLVNGQNWSRARLTGSLEEGMRIVFELKQGPAGRLPVITSITL